MNVYGPYNASYAWLQFWKYTVSTQIIQCFVRMQILFFGYNKCLNSFETYIEKLGYVLYLMFHHVLFFFIHIPVHNHQGKLTVGLPLVFISIFTNGIKIMRVPLSFLCLKWIFFYFTSFNVKESISAYVTLKIVRFIIN